MMHIETISDCITTNGNALRLWATTITMLGFILGAVGTVFGQPAAQHRFAFTTNAGIQKSSNRIDTATFNLYTENGTLTTSQTIGPDLVFDGGAAVRLSKLIAIGVVFSHAQSRTDGTIDAEVPHPFFFDFHRNTQGVASGLLHRELGVHLQGQIWIPVSNSTFLTISGGPTYFNATQDMVTDITATEAGFPFDNVDIGSYSATQISQGALGYNVGADITYLLSDRIGLGFTTRYSRATVDIDLPGSIQQPLKLGGLHTVVGIRAWF